MTTDATIVEQVNSMMSDVESNQTPQELAAAQAATTEGVITEIQERMSGDESDGQDGLTVLGNGLKTGEQAMIGDFVDTLVVGEYAGTDQRFGKVHNAWLNSEQCCSYDQAREVLGKQQADIVDIRCPLNRWEPVVAVNPLTGKEQAGLLYKDSGAVFFPTEHALKNMAVIGGTSSFFVQSLTQDQCHRTKLGEDGEPELLFTRDRLDAELLVYTLKRTLFRADRIDQEKERLFRTWKDGTLRAVLSSLYAIVNNQWVLDVFTRLIPGGLCSHWRGDADSIYGNILIPDTIRVERDSAYGGMLAIGNSEIGMRRLFSMPSAFRSICANGCIWDQQAGCSVNQVHRSKGGLDLDHLENLISTNLNKQIPLLTGLIDKMLDAQTLSMGDVPAKNVLAECGRKYSWSRKQLLGVNQAFHTEQELIGRQTVRTCFGVQAAVTRFGQTLENEQWFKFDQIGGELVALNEGAWKRLITRADNLDDKALTKAYGKDAK